MDALGELIGENTLRLDATELEGALHTDCFTVSECPLGLDNLARPEGVIADTQKMTAKIFGADQSFYLVNGTTVGIHAAVLATCPPGSSCLLMRNCHQSAYNIVLLSGDEIDEQTSIINFYVGCKPEYLKPEFDAKNNVFHGVLPEDVRQSLAAARVKGDRVGAVLILSTTYFGAVVDVKGMILDSADVQQSFK